ncbi:MULTISPECIES: NYN domain-containing protein [unclassified Streptomyces]|uniref:NYN domain-containing protein n=1 Tax=unclassified Streptomyces TaxID=2593676 RepID=UPI0022546EBE|nr:MULTISPECIES: NYN domain-containing protein [unclassified Streptomyces]WSP59968.1 NYN domain-containing protein [Streptomyces sp. NBC_01241]WSU26619.1 NYN domain-containing protein [Streptomyces sp. NBC_01108]MCX4786191.1 NYN domain-containing protein [Streptomyces sp. NBC_01221]MCX4797952.1 NYN domain-containing protein [Streptomyces sp. NBC_01242]WSJ41214.1 NYN domain-containing protein [Streptomyces sp. NBC_01321]
MEQPASGAEPAEAAGEAVEALDRPLPEAVRRRVVALVSDAFGGLTITELPAQLRQYARFTPTRRAKFAGNAMAAALEGDALFRQRIGERLKEGQPELTAALEAGSPPAAADPVDVAAAAYVLRPAGWVKLVAAAGEEAHRADAERADEESRRELERLREELAHARAQTKSETERLRGELDAVRKEADSLQRKLRSAVNEVKRGEAALRRSRAESDAARAEAAAQVSAAESETRRLKARLGEAEAAVEAGRRAAREGRSVEDMRLRLLLDTVLDAARGLRRELALPPSSIRPADSVDAVEPGRMSPKDIAVRALSETDPALLDQLLALPQAHLIVDGYNVTKTGYPQLPLEKQRLRLLGGLAVLAAQTGAEMTCVFDGAELAAPVLLAPPRGVRVLFSKPGVTADELIRQLARAEPPGRPVVVVSTDREVADGVAKAGARPVASVLLLKRLSRV